MREHTAEQHMSEKSSEVSRLPERTFPVGL